MSKRSRARKEQKLQDKLAWEAGLRERRRQSTAGIRRIAVWTGIGVAGGIVIAGLVVGIIQLSKLYTPNITGPFGQITKQELAANNLATLVTNQGDLVIELDTKQTPKTAANFVLLAQKNFYDGVKFHRIVKDFMIQTGDPNSQDDDPTNDGAGGPGYQFDDEKIVGEYARGAVAMANSGSDTNGSQFFIMHQDGDLPPSYVIFGQLVDGFDVLDTIAETPVEDNGQGETSRPTEDIIVETVRLSIK